MNSNAIRGAKRSSFKEFFGDIEQTNRAIAKDRAICSVCVKKKDGAFIKNEKDRVRMLLRTHFLRSYPMMEDNNILSDFAITETRGKK